MPGLSGLSNHSCERSRRGFPLFGMREPPSAIECIALAGTRPEISMGAPALPPVVSLLAIKGRRLKRLTARNAQVVFSHLHPNALECRACSATARSAIVRVHRRRCTATRHLACCLNAMMFYEYFAGRKADRKAHCASACVVD